MSKMYATQIASQGFNYKQGQILKLITNQISVSCCVGFRKGHPDANG